MEDKYRRWHLIQGISCIVYAVFMLLLWYMIYAELPEALMIAAAVGATVSLATAIASGLMRAFTGYKMGLKSTGKDWLIAGIAVVLAIIYLAIRYF